MLEDHCSMMVLWIIGSGDDLALFYGLKQGEELYKLLLTVASYFKTLFIEFELVIVHS